MQGLGEGGGGAGREGEGQALGAEAGDRQGARVEAAGQVQPVGGRGALGRDLGQGPATRIP